MSEILTRVPAKQLMSLYKVAAFEGSVDAFLQQVAQARGKLKRGGIVDVEVRGREGGWLDVVMNEGLVVAAVVVLRRTDVVVVVLPAVARARRRRKGQRGGVWLRR